MKRLGWLVFKIPRVFDYARGAWLAMWIRALGGTCGIGLSVGTRCRFRHPPHRGIRIGDGVTLGPDVVVDVPEGATLELGDRVELSMQVMVAAAQHIRIGPDTMVGEFSSIRDGDHGTAAGPVMADQPTATTPVCIGQDCWIGRGVAVLRGALIHDGAVVGANAVVRGEIPARAIAVGIPCRVVRYRPESC